jgi:hypothetical protein
MRYRLAVPILLLALPLAGCGAHDDREWMKVNQSYTKAEFQRDHRECSRKGDLDEACMRQRGWVAVNPSKSEPPKPPDPLQQRGRY